MDRAKFKEALNQLDSPQRTALLYLEKKIIETKIKTAVPTKETPVIIKELNDKIKNNSNEINDFKSYKKQLDSFVYDIARRSLSLQELVQCYTEEMLLLRKMIGEVAPEYKKSLSQKKHKEFLDLNNKLAKLSKKRKALELKTL